MRPLRRQPTRLPCPWDSPGKNTGVGCHFLLQCMKVKSEREVAQSCPTLSDPLDCSPPGSSVHGIFQARELEWGAIAFCWGLSIVPDMVYLGICSIRQCVLRCCWWSVWYGSGPTCWWRSWFSCLVVPSPVGRGVLQSPTIILYLLIYPLRSIGFPLAFSRFYVVFSFQKFN